MSHNTHATDAEKAAGTTNGGAYNNGDLANNGNFANVGYTGGPRLDRAMSMESQVSPVSVRVRRIMLTRPSSLPSPPTTVSSATLRLWASLASLRPP